MATERAQMDAVFRPSPKGKIHSSFGSALPSSSTNFVRALRLQNAPGSWREPSAIPTCPASATSRRPRTGARTAGPGRSVERCTPPATGRSWMSTTPLNTHSWTSGTLITTREFGPVPRPSLYFFYIISAPQFCRNGYTTSVPISILIAQKIRSE